MDTRFLVAGLILCAAFSTSAEAKLFKWVDNQGVTHYSETLPPQYAGHSHVQLNKEGQEVSPKSPKAKKSSRPTPEEQAAIDQRQKDKALLDTYSNVNEIDLARNRNLQEVNAQINSIKIQIPPAQASFNQHNKEKEHWVKSGRKVPKYLQNDLANDKAKLDRLQQELTRTQNDAKAIRARYDADKKRYRELTGK